VKGTAAELDAYQGEYLTFEWYWDTADEMPARDAFERLTAPEQQSVAASFKHWGSCWRRDKVNPVPPG
jgi:hypothetical protein